MTSTRFRAATLAGAALSLGGLALVPANTAVAANGGNSTDPMISPTDSSYTSVGVSCNQKCQEPMQAPGNNPVEFP